MHISSVTEEDDSIDGYCKIRGTVFFEHVKHLSHTYLSIYVKCMFEWLLTQCKKGEKTQNGIVKSQVEERQQQRLKKTVHKNYLKNQRLSTVNLTKSMDDLS